MTNPISDLTINQATKLLQDTAGAGYELALAGIWHDAVQSLLWAAMWFVASSLAGIITLALYHAETRDDPEREEAKNEAGIFFFFLSAISALTCAYNIFNALPRFFCPECALGSRVLDAVL